MTKRKTSFAALFLTAILCVSFIPQGVAAEETSTTHYAFGMEYDWTNLNDDIEAMTGLPLDDILMDIMQSADDAGIDLLILEELTGTSSMVVDQYTDGTSMYNHDGTDVEVTHHVTELTVRHGTLQDLAIITQWSDAWAGWDLTVSASSEELFNVDAHYVEYRGADGMVYAHDLDMTVLADISVDLGLVGSLEADDGDHVLPLDIGMSLGVGYEIVSSESQVVYEEPSMIHQAISNMVPGSDLEWDADTPNDDEDYVYWQEFDTDGYECEWDSDWESYRCSESYNPDYTYWEIMDANSTYCEWESGYGEWKCYVDNGAYEDWFGYCEYYDEYHYDYGYEHYYACTYDFDWNSAYEYSLNNTNYADGTAPPEYDYYSYDFSYPYCEYYESFGTYQCTYDFGWSLQWELAMSEGWTHYYDETTPEEEFVLGQSDELEEIVESHTGSFSTTTQFSFELTGIPVEEFGLPAGDWDISVIDSVSDSGTFDEDYECDMWMELGDTPQMITTDSGNLEVYQAYGSPMPFGMTCHIPNLFYNAFVGTENAATLEDLIEDSTSEISETLDADTYDTESSKNMWLEVDAHDREEIYVYSDFFDLDYSGDSEYEVDYILTDESGAVIDVASHEFTPYDYWYSHGTYMAADAYGKHCVESTLTNKSNNQEMDSLEVCVDIPKDMEPSELLENIAEGFGDSTIESVMENFGENLEYRLDGYEADVPYDDADMYLLWDTNQNMAVGFQMLVYQEDSDDWYTMVGPQSDTYPVAPVLMSFEYFSGQSAIDQEVELDQDTTLSDLVDLSQHDTSDLDDAIEEATGESPNGDSGDSTDDETEGEDGLLPFVSPMFTVMIIALAGIVASLRSRIEE